MDTQTFEILYVFLSVYFAEQVAQKLTFLSTYRFVCLYFTFPVSC